MGEYLVFLVIAFLTVLSPGPGVVLTITNALRFGIPGALPGILGIAFSTFIVASFAAAGLAVALAVSTVAFTVIKFIGAAYLIYLGVKLWRSDAINVDRHASSRIKSKRIGFVEGVFLQLTNPKAVFFFISVLPQFIDHTSDVIGQFWLFVSTYSMMVVVIHIGYAYLARTARNWFSMENNSRLVNKIGGSVFMAFGCGLATANK